MRRGKWKYIFIKTCMSSDKDTLRNRIKTSKPLVGCVVTKKDTRETSGFKFMLGVSPQVWET